MADARVKALEESLALGVYELHPLGAVEAHAQLGPLLVVLGDGLHALLVSVLVSIDDEAQVLFSLLQVFLPLLKAGVRALSSRAPGGELVGAVAAVANPVVDHRAPHHELALHGILADEERLGAGARARLVGVSAVAVAVVIVE